MTEPTDDPQCAWAQAWVAAWADLSEIGTTQEAEIETKKGRNFSYKYSSLGDILSTVRPILTQHDLAVSQNVVDAGDGRVGVETAITHAGGHAEVFGPVVMPTGADPRNVGSAITYARRYGLSAALGIASEDDDDAASASRPAAEPTAVDPHDEAWEIALELFAPDSAANEFMSALESAGVKSGERATRIEADIAVKAMRVISLAVDNA